MEALIFKGLGRQSRLSSLKQL